jgi:hypothetical protein
MGVGTSEMDEEALGVGGKISVPNIRVLTATTFGAGLEKFLSVLQHVISDVISVFSIVVKFWVTTISFLYI